MRYEAPKTLDAAVSLLANARSDARLLAGGTDVLVQMRAGRLRPGLLVDVKGIPELRSIAAHDGGYRVGAAVTCMELMEHEEFARSWPGVIDGVRVIGSIQVKGRATLGGNLCNASPAADSVPALIAAGAAVSIIGPRGRREVPVEPAEVRTEGTEGRRHPADPARRSGQGDRASALRRRLQPAGPADRQGVAQPACVPLMKLSKGSARRPSRSPRRLRFRLC
jgi:carbon-monoxide dehydrogenase medium subunit